MHLVPLTLLLLRLLLESYALSNSDMANIQEVLEICLACKKQVLSPIFFFQVGTYQAQNTAEQFFRKVPTDNRFIQVTEQEFEPKSSLQVKKAILYFILKRHFHL